MRSKQPLNSIQLVYEAAHNGEKWKAALQSIAKLVNADSGAMLSLDHEVKEANGSYTYNIPDELLALYNTRGDDPNYPIMLHAVPLGHAVAADDVITDRKELETRYGNYYSEVMKPFGHYYIAGIFLFNDEHRAVALGFQRSYKTGPWEKEELQLLTDIAPHIQRSLILYKEYTKLRTHALALKSGLNNLTMGVIVFNNHLEIIYSNPIADSVLDYHPALKRIKNNLYATNHEDTKRINIALKKAQTYLFSNLDSYSNSVSALGLKHPDKPIPLSVMIKPSNKELLETESCCTMYINDPDNNQPIVPEALQSTFNLTPKESMVAIGIANGLTIKEIANQQGVQESSTKTHLKSVFGKLGINRQTQLVKILLSGPFRVDF